MTSSANQNKNKHLFAAMKINLSANVLCKAYLIYPCYNKTLIYIYIYRFLQKYSKTLLIGVKLHRFSVKCYINILLYCITFLLTLLTWTSVKTDPFVWSSKVHVNGVLLQICSCLNSHICCNVFPLLFVEYPLLFKNVIN